MKRLALFGFGIGGLLATFYVALPLIADEPEPTVPPLVPIVAAPTATPLPVAPTPFVPSPTSMPTPEPLPPLGGKCTVHGDLLQRDSVPILYGMPEYSVNDFKEIAAASQKYFPNSVRIATGGCLVWEGMPTHRNVLFCPTCRTVEDKWLAEHPLQKAKVEVRSRK